MIFIQARLGSTRYPDKVLAKVGDEVLISRVINACLASKIGHNVVALLPTEDRGSRLEEFLNLNFKNSINIAFGSNGNLYQRFRSTLVEFYDLFLEEPTQLGLVRVCADRPYLQSDFLDVLVHNEPHQNFLFNHVPPPHGEGPIGLGAESFHRNTAHHYFLERQPQNPDTMEHVTSDVYESDSYNKTYLLPSTEWSTKLANLRFDLDTPEDLDRIRTNVEIMNKAFPHRGASS